MTKIDFEKAGGLVPAILQHHQTGQVLMLGYMNRESFDKTREEGVAWFYSRSKERLWKKGEESGNVQKVVDIALDCDQDTILLQVDPLGPTCHTGQTSCFGEGHFNLSVLEQTISEKIKHPQEGSYTKYLVDEGQDKIIKKCGEEMTEVIIAAKNNDKEELINEASDLAYHLLVLLQQHGVSLAEVEAKLGERHGQKQHYSIRSEINEW